MSESLQIQVAVLATEVRNLIDANQADREENRKFRELVMASHKLTDEKLSLMKSTLDMAKGGWAVLAVAGMVAAGAFGMITNAFKFFHA